MKQSITYRTFLLIVLGLIRCLSLYSITDTWQIAGTLIDKATDNPIAFAHIKLASGSIVTSDTLGQFQIDQLQPDSVLLTITHTSYVTLQTVIYKQTLQRTTLQLTQKQFQTEEVKVTAQTPTLAQRDQTGIHTINQKDILKTPQFMGEADVLQTLKQLPGIQTANDGNSAIYIRGGTAGQNYVELDGIELLNPSHVMGIFSVFNPLLTHSVDIYKGTTPIHLNSRQSASILVKSPNNPTQTHWNCNIGNVASNLTYNGLSANGKWYWHAGVRRSFTETFESVGALLLSDEENYFKQHKYRFYDCNAKLRYAGVNNSLELNFYKGSDKFDINRTNLSSLVSWGNMGASLLYQTHLGANLWLNSTLNYSEYSSNFSAYMPSGYIALSSEYNHLRSNISFLWHTQNHMLRWGFKATRYSFLPQKLNLSLFGAANNVNYKYHSFNGTLFFSDAITLTDKWTVYAGAELGYYDLFNIEQAQSATTTYPTTNQYHISPQTSITYKPKPNLTVKAAYNFNKQFLHYATIAAIPIPSDIWMPATNNLNPEYGHQASVGIFKDLPKINGEVGLDIYGKRTYNQLILTVNTNNKEVNTFDDNFNIGEGYAYGCELFFKGKIHNLSSQISYTLAKVKQRYESLNHSDWFDAVHDRRHDLSITLSYPINKRIELNSAFTYATGNKATLPTGRYWMIGQIANDYTEINNYRMPSYHRLDVSLDYHLKTKLFYESILNVSIINIYNHANPFFIYYQTESSDKSYELEIKAKQVSLFPILPSVSWRFKF